ncbi:hypothetical protein QWE_00065 [Agrobacterium albertimagni AOL15]|uniref:Uncharacterized protein n=1 Tax=Agrobacterium albertimagni AOL15 TaxID=1156935 RepID=K2QK26_9HYPH|nr:hypothetical protein [Agrobacterium albertimagni]EKF61551.1 hypothetical protein QWE_00065 [Agrobacterium albertimagni AOL15]
MKILGLPTAFLFTLVTANFATAGSDEQKSSRLGIGGTGVFCYQLPCPWRGVIDLTVPLADRLRPLWSGQHIPDLIATAADKERIVTAWEALECLEIEGQIITAATRTAPPVLRVDRVLGACT